MAYDVNRRQFLQLGAAAAAALAVDACVQPTVPTLPSPGRLGDIDHFVIFIQENRSFDHYFGTRPNVRGFGDPAVQLTGAGGKPVWFQPSTSHPDGYVLPFRSDIRLKTQCMDDINHGWDGLHAAANNGRMDGFATSIDPGAMAYFAGDDIPFYSALADRYTVCDGYHCSVLGPTTPNRMYTMAATIDPQALGGGPVTGNLTGPFTFETYPERLQKAGISWRVYHEADDYDDNPLKWFKNFIDSPANGPLAHNALQNRTFADFASDVARNELPQVSWIVAKTVFSEHPPWTPSAGEDLVHQYLSALWGNQQVWSKSAFILTYDENGGFFDHVPPPLPPAGTADEFVNGQPIGLGVRVPTMVISPWSRGGRVCHETFDHTSTLRLLETRFGVEVPNLSAWRRATTGDLTSAFNFARGNAAVPPVPATTKASAASFDTCFKLPHATPPAHQRVPTAQWPAGHTGG